MPSLTTNTKPTFRSIEGAKARSWLARSTRDLRLVCELADIETNAMLAYARSVIGMGAIV